MRKLLILTVLFSFFSCKNEEKHLLPGPEQNIVFTELAKVWDEAIPLGNGLLGSLVWEKEGRLRFSLDRSDLWDLRPISYLQQDEFSFDWVYEKWSKNEYRDVQALFDAATYSQSIAPSKIPGAALEFWFDGMDSVVRAELNISDATCLVEWANGLKLETFIQADEPLGYFRFSGIRDEISIKLIPPVYQKEDSEEQVDEVTGQELTRLGYEQGKIVESLNRLSYHQKGWGDFYYDVDVAWEAEGEILTGSWSVSTSIAENKGLKSAKEVLDNRLGCKEAHLEHSEWWSSFWSASSIDIPDQVLEKQWYLEQYKFGSAARDNTPPISLQAVWTADNGRMPPWKGDFHHDLNTQLSYWPAYSANHLNLEKGFLNWLWEIKPVAEAYTGKYFGVEGLNVPGVSTLEGEPMGGWIQYSCGPTVSAWLAHHFYLHWKYTLDRVFLEERAYPWLREVAVFLENFSVFDDEGMRKLPLSSSPEIHNNSREAWFSMTTNFDLALIRFTFSKAAELANELGLGDEANHWENILSQWPGFSVDETGLNFAPGEQYQESHRHFSHLMAWHPLGLIDWSNGDKDREIILNTLSTLEKYGPDWWTGYSYAWLGNLYARAFMGDKAAGALRDFADCFCLKNSFHVNGDQCKAGKSRFTYRPFTLEGNFAFAAGIQEMLLQSHAGIIRIFPAIPEKWKNVSFRRLRTEGGFLVSSEMREGRVVKTEITATVDGKCKILNPNDKNTVDEYIMLAGEKKIINY